MFTDESQDTSPEIEVQDDVVEVEDTTDGTEETTEATTPDWEAEAKKWRAIAQRNQKKSEKAETRTTPEPAQLSAVDILAVSKAGIEPEDLEDVMEYANFKKISLHEALKSSVVKATIAEKQELRKSADATNTASARRGTTSISDERLLSDAAKGNLPDSDDDLRRLIALQRKARRG